MKRGFTIIELLVASLLLGMLMTILTMIFNQSSIAWRTGIAGTVDMSNIRNDIAEIREEADNAFVWGGELFRITSVWDRDGNLRLRACDVSGSGADADKSHADILRSKISNKSSSLKPSEFDPVSVPVNGSDQAAKSAKNYFVNVMSYGPDGQVDTWDDICSWPDAWN